MMMMPHAPPPPSRPPVVKYFCPHLQIETVGFLRRNGQYYYYCFDYTENTFKALECLGCQAETRERDLYPLYAEFSKDLNEYVFFAFNNSSLKAEKFVFDHRTGGFREVIQPEMVYDTQRKPSETLCVVKGTDEYGEVVIQIDRATQTFKKSRAYNGQFMILPPVRVRTNMIEKLHDFPVTTTNAAMYRCPFPHPKNTFTIIFQTCLRYPSACLVCVLQEDGSYLRFYFSERTGDFHQFKCDECCGPVTENFLRPLHVLYSKIIGEPVLFVENRKSFNIEQYILCKETLGFKQVVAMDVSYDPKLFNNGHMILRVEVRNGLVLVSKAADGTMEKYLYKHNGEYEKIPSKEVKTLEVQKKEKIQEERKKRLPKTASDYLEKMYALVGTSHSAEMKQMEELLLQLCNPYKQEPPMVQPTRNETPETKDTDENSESHGAIMKFPNIEEDSDDSDESDIDDESDSEESDSGSDDETIEKEESEASKDSEPLVSIEETEKILQNFRTQAEEVMASLAVSMRQLEQNLEYLDVSKHQEQPKSTNGTFPYGPAPLARKISSEYEESDDEDEEDSDESEIGSESGCEKVEVSEKSESGKEVNTLTIQKQEREQMDPLAAYKRYLVMKLQQTTELLYGQKEQPMSTNGTYPYGPAPLARTTSPESKDSVDDDEEDSEESGSRSGSDSDESIEQVEDSKDPLEADSGPESSTPMDTETSDDSITENSLRPLYVVYSNEIGEQVIFMDNTQSFKVEQYIFCQETWGFKQVEAKDVVYDERLINNSTVVMRVATEHGLIYMMNNRDRSVEKHLFMADGACIKIKPTEVKTLAMQKKEAEEQKDLDDVKSLAEFVWSVQDEMDKMRQLPVSEQEEPSKLNSTESEESKDSDVNNEEDSEESGSESVSDSDESIEKIDDSKDHHEAESGSETGSGEGSVDKIGDSENSDGSTSEESLYPLYAAYSKEIGEKVVFMDNTQNFNVEQYIFCQETWRFKQVEAKDVVYDERLINNSTVVMSVTTKHGLIYLLKNPDGFAEKHLFMANGALIKIKPTEVKTLAMQKKKVENSKDHHEAQSEFVKIEDSQNSYNSDFDEYDTCDDVDSDEIIRDN